MNTGTDGHSKTATNTTDTAASTAKPKRAKKASSNVLTVPDADLETTLTSANNNNNVDRSPSLRQRAKATAHNRRLMSAAQSREANMAVVLVCTVTMFLFCHMPRAFIVM